MNDLNLDFRIFEGLCHDNQLSFFEISFFFAVTPKRRDIGIWSGETKRTGFALPFLFYDNYTVSYCIFSFN